MNQLSEIIKFQGELSDKVLSLEPPNYPWMALGPNEHPGGYLCYYYSDDLSALPVRCVTKPGDNKSDPNLETKTYGLFSTCNRYLRSGVVKHDNPFIFFVTRYKGPRALSGYYHTGWYAQGVLAKNDFCLAADKSHFIYPPKALEEVDRLLGTTTSRWFRTFKQISPDDCLRLMHFLDSFGDASTEYLAEINRLEMFNLKHGGYRYVGWRQIEKFSWEYAQRYFGKNHKILPALSEQNSAPGDLWLCRHCGKTVMNKALLKLCPHCGEPGALFPAKNAIK